MNVIDSMDRGNGAKWLAMLSLGLGSFLSGILPAAISERNRRRFPLSTSLMLCFGAGVLLATALVHMLPDVRKAMPNNAEIYFCGGFFIVYFIDEFIHYFFGEAIQHSHSEASNATNHQSHNHSHSHSNYGSNNESDPLIGAHTSRSHEDRKDNCETIVRQANERICHTSHREPCAQSMTGAFGLFVALSLHSFVEGLAIGVQDSSSKVLFLLGAVACHKFVMGFCLGLEFRSNAAASFRAQLMAVLTFSLGSVIGIGAGMVLVSLPSDSSSTTVLSIIQALAGGTLFYVTVCEVMPREKARWHQNRERRMAGLAQFFAVGLGFTVMTIINFYIGEDE